MITPLIVSELHYQNLVRVSKEALGNHISADSSHFLKNLEIISKFFNQPNFGEGSLLKHSFYGFLIFESYEVLAELRIESDLNINIVKTLRSDIFIGVVSGNLQQWRDSIINCFAQNISHNLRKLIKEILDHFYSIGLGVIFSKYRLSSLNDGTYKLELKK
jgi:hypothetical protein